MNMCNVPPKFYQLCRLCLAGDNDALFMFGDGGGQDIPRRIMTCLSITVSVYPIIQILQCPEMDIVNFLGPLRVVAEVSMAVVLTGARSCTGFRLFWDVSPTDVYK